MNSEKKSKTRVISGFGGIAYEETVCHSNTHVHLIDIC